MAKHTITTKFNIETDDESLKQVLGALAELQAQQDLADLLAEAMQAYLAQHSDADLDVETDVRMGVKLHPRSGPRYPVPTCRGGILTRYNPKLNAVETLGSLESEAVQTLLQSDEVKAFRFVSAKKLTLTIYRRPDGRWYASRRFDGGVRRRQIGGLEKLTVPHLDSVAEALR